VTTVPVPKDALDWFRDKGYKVGFDHRDVWQEEHAAAFTVAKAMRLDILEGIRAAMDKALAEGQSFGQFRRELQPLLERMGWWGRQELFDPLEGAEREVQLGSPRRLKTIYNTNLRTARAAGQWQRIQRAKATHPYLLYQLGPSREHRVEHMSWAGRLLPVDHPWWQTHFPPNGWGCKCHVRAVSKREAERLRAQGAVSEVAPDEGEQEYVNQRTGEVLQVPKGIEPGWAYNPGSAGRLEPVLLSLQQKLDRSDPGLARITVRRMGEVLSDWQRSPRGVFPLGWLASSAPAIGDLKSQVVVLGATSQRADLSQDDWAQVQPALDEGVLLEDGKGRVTIVRLLLGGGAVVIKARSVAGVLHMTELRRLSATAAARDADVQRLGGRGDG
jgi:hypothetical protein